MSRKHAGITGTRKVSTNRDLRRVQSLSSISTALSVTWNMKDSQTGAMAQRLLSQTGES
jgi:hypothetical protein